MGTIHLPFYSDARSVVVPGWGTVHLKSFQILVFVRITEQGLRTPPETAPIFPALFDSGNSFCFTLNEEQRQAAVGWGTQLKPLRKAYTVRDSTGTAHPAKGWLADVWLYAYDCNNPPPSLNRGTSLGDTYLKLSLAQDGIASIDSRKHHISGPTASRAGRFSRWLRSFSGTGEQQAEPVVDPPDAAYVIARQRDSRTDRLSLPNLPLLGLRAFCLNSLRLEMVCTPKGGRLKIEDLARSGVAE